MIRATFSCNLSCNKINVALQVEIVCCSYYNLLAQQILKHTGGFARATNLVNTNAVNVTSSLLATSLPGAQWLERLTVVREEMGSIPVGGSDFFFVQRS